jgi:4-aminobutyrate aminotransferase-like enzyme
MTGPDPEDAVRKIIDDEVAPRLADYRMYVAAADPDPIPVARADLLYFWDDYRTEYLDWASLGNPVGHNHPVVARSVGEHFRYYSQTAPQGRHAYRWTAQYARDLSAQFTGRDEDPRRVLFTEGEREAVTQAARLAAGRKPLFAVGGDYDWMTCGHLTYPTVFDPADADWDRAGALLINFADLQAHTMRAGAARRWMLAAREAGVPVIVDETVTGFGRLGRMWGYLYTGLSPDVVVLGGAAGGGYPLGAVIARPEMFSAPIDVSGQSGNPVACCAGSATLLAVTLGTLDYMTESGQVLTTGLDELVAQFGTHLAGQHGEGHLRGLRMRTPGDASRLVVQARARGLYLAPTTTTTVVLAPALVTSTHEVKRGIDLLADILLGWDEGPPP